MNNKHTVKREKKTRKMLRGEKTVFYNKNKSSNFSLTNNKYTIIYMVQENK